MRLSPILVACLTASLQLSAQEIDFPKGVSSTSAALPGAMTGLARATLAGYRDANRDRYLNTVFRLQTVAGEHAAALTTLAELRALRRATDPRFAPTEYTQYELYARVSASRASGATDQLSRALRDAFVAVDTTMEDLVAFRVAQSLEGFDLDLSRAQLERAIAAASATGKLSVDDAVRLCRSYHTDLVYRALLPHMPPLLRESEARRYAITEAARVPLRDGGALSAVIVRPRRLAGRQPAVLEFTIYANEANKQVALESAAHGFVGVVATTRGKRISAGPVVPWEPDAADARDLLDWIETQPWSNGMVGMMGGSYSGFTQWAAAKSGHRALRTIVPTAAVAPGIDFPRENGIALNFQFAWSRYVGSNALLDDASYADRSRWNRLDSTWFAQGSAYRALDVIDGAPNPLWRRWLDHPTYDDYWQAMIPTANEFARLAIPVLSITGYFDGAQPGALHYFRKHVAQRPGAQHTLLIGPWDHFGAQRRPSAVLGGLRIDPVANVAVIDIVYDWMDHVLRNKPRPALLADRVNFQVHGTNQWRHVPTLAAMSTDTLNLHLRAVAGTTEHRLTPVPGEDEPGVALVVDFADRLQVSSTFITPGAVDTLDRTNGLVFVGEPLAKATAISGAFGGELVSRVNRHDVDIGVVLYEQTANGEYHQLSYSLGRASLAHDATQRRLLVPGARERIPVNGARITSRVVAAGSRLVVVVNVNKNEQSQLNYGSGKDPSDETIADAVEPLQLVIFGDSRLRIPILP